MRKIIQMEIHLLRVLRNNNKGTYYFPNIYKIHLIWQLLKPYTHLSSSMERLSAVLTTLKPAIFAYLQKVN